MHHQVIPEKPTLNLQAVRGGVGVQGHQLRGDADSLRLGHQPLRPRRGEVGRDYFWSKHFISVYFSSGPYLIE